MYAVQSNHDKTKESKRNQTEHRDIQQKTEYYSQPIIDRP